MHHYLLITDTPVGPIHLIGNESELSELYFDSALTSVQKSRIQKIKTRGSNPVLQEAALEISRYFLGALKTFSVPISAKGTDFQLACWSYLNTIPYGETRSYFDEASGLGNAKSVRAVGQANGRNPLPLIVPCHRVIAKDRTLGGYSGGLQIKQFLLSHENQNANRKSPS